MKKQDAINGRKLTQAGEGSTSTWAEISENWVPLRLFVPSLISSHY